MIFTRGQMSTDVSSLTFTSITSGQNGHTCLNPPRQKKGQNNLLTDHFFTGCVFSLLTGVIDALQPLCSGSSSVETRVMCVAHAQTAAGRLSRTLVEVRVPSFGGCVSGFVASSSGKNNVLVMILSSSQSTAEEI